MGSPAFSGQLLKMFLCCCLPVQVLVVDLLRGLVAECRVQTLDIVAELDVPGNVFAGVLAGRVDGTVHPLNLHRGVERLRLGVDAPIVVKRQWACSLLFGQRR